VKVTLVAIMLVATLGFGFGARTEGYDPFATVCTAAGGTWSLIDWTCQR
jgi:hypothetical protein